MNKTISRSVRSAPHTRGSHVCTPTRSAVSWVQSVKPWRWSSLCLPRFGSVLSGARTPLHALSPLTHTHTRSHTIYSRARTPGDAHFPCVCLKVGGEQQWSGTGLFFGRGQTLARLEGGHHSIPTPTPKGGDSLGPLLDLHLLGELHFRYIVQAFLQIGGGVFRLSQHSWIRLFLVPSFEGDLDSWTMSNGDELLTHMVQHMDGAEGNTFYFHLQHCWAVWLIAHLFVFHIIIIIIIVIMRYQISLIFSFGHLFRKYCFHLHLLQYYHTSITWYQHSCRLTPILSKACTWKTDFPVWTNIASQGGACLTVCVVPIYNADNSTVTSF